MITEKIVEVFEGFRMSPTPIDQFEQIGRSVLTEKISSYVNNNIPIDFVMLGYPMKSPNFRDKVIGQLPDMAEQVSVTNFSDFGSKIQSIYAPGININIVSDGQIFADVMRVDDRIVAMYEEVIRDMMKDTPITFYNAKDFYSKKICLRGVRNKILNNFGISSEELSQRILIDPDVKFLYQGMIRFMETDLAIRDYSSNNQLHKEAKKVARDMMFRNEAYSQLVRSEFSDSIRLSMHPSINNGSKFSFQLIPSPKAWTSPWHCALAMVNGQYETIHRKDAEKNGYELVYKDGRPYYFQAN